MKITAMLMSLVFLGCGDDEAAGQGALRVEIWGEDYIEDGIPASEFEDGWSLTFDSFLINIGDISVATGEAAPSLVAAEPRVYDLAAASGPIAIATEDAPTGTYDHTAYAQSPATADSVPGNATAKDVALMTENEYSVFVKGSAIKGERTVRFAWGFSHETIYDPCHSLARLEDGGEATVQLTIHGDHLFYDDAVSESPGLRFEDIALADADSDNDITRGELEAYDIGSLPNYGVGSLDIDNLWSFVEHMTSTLGHIDGEGHCVF